MKNIVPLQIWEGESSSLIEEALKYFQINFCTQTTDTSKISNCFCSNCKKIKTLTHPSILWLNPIKNYTVDDIEKIFEKTQFNLEENEEYFLVLEKAHYLTTITANRLLKILEEPPKGYNFILLTNNLEKILPTILSRGIIKQFSNKNESNNLEEFPLLKYFLDKNKLNDPALFTTKLKELEITDNNSLEMLNILFKIFVSQKNDSYRTPNNMNEKEKLYLDKALNFIKKQLLIPPQSGSATLFWKNFYLNFPK